MKYLLLSAFFFLAAMNPGDENDLRLFGRWRGPKPLVETDPNAVWQFDFDKKKVKITQAFYDWDAQAQSWTGRTAEVIADGEDDEWYTENGYLSIKIRERYVKNLDLHLKYEIRGDSLDFWEAEIFKGKGGSLTGDWRLESYDENYPDFKRVRQISFTADGYMVEEFKKNSVTFRYALQEDRILQILPGKDGEFDPPGDTLIHPYQIVGENLYLRKPEVSMRLLRREKK